MGTRGFWWLKKKVCKTEVYGVQSSGCCGVENASFRRKTDVGWMKKKRRCRLAGGGREENKGWAAQKHGAGSAAARTSTPPAPPPVLSPLSLSPPRSSRTPRPPVNVAPGLVLSALGLLFVLGAPLSPNPLIETGAPFHLISLTDPWLCPLSGLRGDLEAPRPRIELPNKQRTARCRARR